MKYTIENDGIHLIVETEFDADYPADKPPIPIAEAVETLHKIRDRIDATLTPCECEQQGARKCGACDG